MSQDPLLDAGVSPLLSVCPQLVSRQIYGKFTEVQAQDSGLESNRTEAGEFKSTLTLLIFSFLYIKHHPGSRNRTLHGPGCFKLYLAGTKRWGTKNQAQLRTPDYKDR